MLLATGVAGRFDASVAVNIPGVALTGNFLVEVNKTGAAVNTAILLNGESVTLTLEDADFIRVAGRGVRLDVLGQTLSGDFFFEQTTNSLGDTRVRVAGSNIELNLGDGLLTLTSDDAIDGPALFLLGPDGFAGSFSGAVAVNVPNVSFSARLTVRVNNTGVAINETFTGVGSLNLTAGHYVQVIGVDVSLDVLGQVITGDFAIEASFTADGTAVVKVALSDIGFQISAGGNVLLSLSGASGGFIITPNGVAASTNVPNPSVNLQITVPGLSGIAFGPADIPLTFNTIPTPVLESFAVDIGGLPISVDLNLPIGPFVDITIPGLNVSIDGLAVSGDFSFSQFTTDLGTITQIGIANFGASVEFNGEGFR